MTALPKFTTDYLDELGAQFEAIAYGETWNGWSTPVVTKETFEQMARTLDREDGVIATLTFDQHDVATFAEGGEEVDTNVHEIAPNADGGYDLGCLGWCFDTIDENAEV